MRTEELEVALQAILEIASHAMTTIYYGGYAGGDPRDFAPDPECCTPEEIAAWKAACDAANAGQPYIATPHEHEFEMTEVDGKKVLSVRSRNSSFGVGQVTVRDPDMTVIARIAREALGEDS